MPQQDRYGIRALKNVTIIRAIQSGLCYDHFWLFWKLWLFINRFVQPLYLHCDMKRNRKI